MKKLIAFDLDDTLATTKQPITEPVAELLVKLAALYKICVITGGSYDQLKNNAIDKLHAPAEQLTNFHFMSVSGARYHHFDSAKNEWEHDQYIEDFSEETRKHITDVLKNAAEDLGLWESDPAGNIIDFRGSQITYSALGQKAHPSDKYAWDPDQSKRRKMYERMSSDLSEFEVKVNGTTSIDVTRQGADKAFGLQKLSEILDIELSEMVFVGDQFQEGGNDYPVRAIGVDTIEVTNAEQTLYVIQGMLAVSSKSSDKRGAA